MGLLVLAAGLVVFFGAHGFTTMRGARKAAIARLGINPYRVLYSLVSVAGIALIVAGFGLYRQTGWIDVWHPPRALRHLAIGLMLPAIVFFVAAFLPGHITRWTKHPMLLAIKLWALAHLLANGDLGSILLFGSFLIWAGYARVSAKSRGSDGEFPFRTPIEPGWRNDILALVLGILIYLALGYVFHPIVIGVAVFGGA